MRHLSRQGLTRLVLAGALLLVGYGVAAAQTARVGREFKLKAGRVVTLDGRRLQVRFVRVLSDSRCPVDVDCVWAGNAEVLIEVGPPGWRKRATLRLNTNASPERPGEATFEPYTVKLVGLAPQPHSTGKRAPGRYTATLLVTKE